MLCVANNALYQKYLAQPLNVFIKDALRSQENCLSLSWCGAKKAVYQVDPAKPKDVSINKSVRSHEVILSFG